MVGMVAAMKGFNKSFAQARYLGRASAGTPMS
jgi:hypothetical protein